MITLDTYIDKGIDLSERETEKYRPSYRWHIRRNNLVIGKKISSLCVFASVKKSLVIYRTFDKDKKLDNGLSFYNPFNEDGVFYLMHPPFPEKKEGATWIVTKGTLEFLILLDHVDTELLHKMQEYKPPYNSKIDNPRYDYGKGSREDFILNNKKIGSKESVVYNNQYYATINLNGAAFSTDDRNDIYLLMNKYNDHREPFKNKYNDMGKIDISFDQFKEHIIDYFKDTIDFKFDEC